MGECNCSDHKNILWLGEIMLNMLRKALESHLRIWAGIKGIFKCEWGERRNITCIRAAHLLAGLLLYEVLRQYGTQVHKDI